MCKSGRAFWICGCVAGFLAVALGAFGAHGLRGRLSPEMMEIFETGARYQLIHALALLLAAYATQGRGRSATVAGWLFTVGIVIFSGSLYALALTGVKMFGAVTPMGGICLLSGWVALSIAGLHWRGRPGGSA